MPDNMSPLHQELNARVEEARAVLNYVFSRSSRNYLLRSDEYLDELFSYAWIRMVRNLQNRVDWPCAFSTFVARHCQYALPRMRAEYDSPDLSIEEHPLPDPVQATDPSFREVDQNDAWECVSVWLDDRERRIVERLYGLNGQPELRPAEVGRLEGMSRQRVMQIAENALQILGQHPDIHILTS